MQSPTDANAPEDESGDNRQESDPASLEQLPIQPAIAPNPAYLEYTGAAHSPSDAPWLPSSSALPPDLRTPLSGYDLLILAAFYFIGGAVITLLVVAAAIHFFGVPREALVESAMGKPSLIILSQALLSGAVLALLFGMIRSRGTADFWPSVGWRRFPGNHTRAASIMRYVFGGFVLAALMGWLSSYVDRDMVLPMEELLRDRQSVLLLTGLGVLVAPLFEETIFRGCIYPVLARRWGVSASVLITGILFGAAHAPQLWPGYAQIALLMVVGVTLTYVRARTGTVAASYFVHLGYNSIFFAGFYFATGGLRHFPS